MNRHAVVEAGLDLEQDLRSSLTVRWLALAIAQADFNQKGLPRPNSLQDLSPQQGQRYQDAAVAVLMSFNPDAVKFAETQAAIVAYQAYAESAPFEDEEEAAINRVGRRAAKAYCQTLSLIRPGLLRYLKQQAVLRATDSDPDCA